MSLKKTLAFCFLFLCLVISTYYYANSIYLPGKVESRVKEYFSSLGFETFDIGSIERKYDQVKFKDINLDPDGFSTISSITVKYAILPYLFNSQSAHEIIINKMNLTGDIGEDSTIRVSGWTWPKDITQKIRGIPTRKLKIEQTQISFLTADFGGLTLTVNGHIQNQSNITEIKAHVDTSQKNLSFTSKINGKIDQAGILSSEMILEDLSFERQDWSFRRGTANIKSQYKDKMKFISADSQFASIKWGNIPLKDTHILLEPNKIGDFSLLSEGKVFGPENIEWSSHVSFKNGNVITKSTVTPEKLNDIITFLERNKNITLEDNLPDPLMNVESPIILIEGNKESDGSFSGKFDLMITSPNYTISGEYKKTLDGNTILGTVFSSPKNIALADKAQIEVSTAGDFTISNIQNAPHIMWETRINIDSGHIDFGAIKITPLHGEFIYGSSKNQTSAITFLPPLKPHIPYQTKVGLNVDKSNTLRLDDIQLKIYDGQIKSSQPLIIDGKVTNKNKLIVSDISLAQFFYDAGLRNFRVSGKIGGVIPLDIKDNKRILTSGAILQSQDRGIIQLPESIINGLFPGTSRQDFIIRQALKNFHYEFFEIRLDGNLKGLAMITINANGYNPDLYSKESINVNLQIETQISALFSNLFH